MDIVVDMVYAIMEFVSAIQTSQVIPVSKSNVKPKK
jgi:hypothetical protein